MNVPTVCPKCSGNLVNIGGKPVCEKCFHTVELGAAAAQAQAPAPSPRPASAPAQGPSPAPAQAPGWSGPNAEGRPNPAPQQAQQAQPAPPQPAGPVCPKCAGNLVDIGGKPVCEKCFHTVETGSTGPSPAPNQTARTPMPQPAQSPGPAAGGSAGRPISYAPQPTPPGLSPPAQQGGSISAGECPKCSGTLMDIGGKPVCEQCFYVVDTPSSPARMSSTSSPFASPVAQKLAPPPPTNCPKCSGKLVEAGGNLVCGDCYHVVDQPSATPARPSNSFTPRRTGAGEEEPMSPQMIGGIALILLLILMIIVLAIRH